MMIIKSLSRKSNTTGQLLAYILRYVAHTKEERPSSTAGRPFIIKHNIRSRSVNGYIKEFKDNEAFRLVRRKDSVKIFHTVLSLSKYDRLHITDAMLRNIAHEFIQQRGVTNLYVGTKHEDKEHIHLHLAISGTQLNGKSSRITKQKFHSIKLALDRYQKEKYPTELAHSLPDHNRSRKLAKERLLETLKANRQTDKHTLVTELNKLFNQSRSKAHFYEQLTANGYPLYYRNGKPQGILYNRKYRFSRLGFHDEILQSLEIKEREDQTLLQLKNLRSGHPLQSLKDKHCHKAVKVPEADDAIQALEDIRSKNMEAEEHGLQPTTEEGDTPSVLWKLRGIRGISPSLSILGNES